MVNRRTPLQLWREFVVLRGSDQYGPWLASLAEHERAFLLDCGVLRIDHAGPVAILSLVERSLLARQLYPPQDGERVKPEDMLGCPALVPPRPRVPSPVTIRCIPWWARLLAVLTLLASLWRER